MYRLLVQLLTTALFITRNTVLSDDCTDINGNKDSKGWVYIEKLNGLSVSIPDSGFNSTYEISVCKNLLKEDPNEHVGALEITSDNRTIVVGRYNESDLMYGTHWILLKYMNGEPYDNGTCSTSHRHAAIMFVCNHNVDTLDKASIIDENLGRDRNCYHLFEIEHCLACISDGCRAFFSRLSPGSIILIALFSVTAVYLLVGWIYTRCIKKKRGWRQIPNAEFWQEIGHLQADGCNMVCRCGKRPSDEYHIVAGESVGQPQDLMSDDEILLPP